MGSTARSQRGHSPVSPLSAAAIGLTSGSAAEPAAPASAAAIGAVVPVVVAPRVRVADTVNGFPQSMQKRDDDSFSRPQKAQAAGGLTGAVGTACEANIPREGRVGDVWGDVWGDARERDVRGRDAHVLLGRAGRRSPRGVRS